MKKESLNCLEDGSIGRSFYGILLYEILLNKQLSRG